MSSDTLPPPPLGRGLAPWHLLVAALGSSALTAGIVVVGLAGRGDQVERSVRRGIEGGVEQALAPAVVHDRSAVAGRGLMEGLVDGALDQVDGPRAEVVLGRTLDAGSCLAEVGLDTGLKVGLGLTEALGAPSTPVPTRPAPRADVAPVESATPRPRPTTREAGRLAEEVLELGFGLVDDVLGTRVDAPEQARAGRAGWTPSSSTDDVKDEGVRDRDDR